MIKKCVNITIEQALQLIDTEDVLIVDVRNSEEYKDNHLLNSINIPAYEILRIRDFEKNKKRCIILYCSSGARSLAACQILADVGYERVFNLYGGISLQENV